MERYIYYSCQKNWTMEDYDYLNSFLTKIFEYREKDEYKDRISHMNLYVMNNKTKAIIKAILNTLNIMDKIIREYPNLKEIENVKPLKEPLILVENPTNLFKSYMEMNIII